MNESTWIKRMFIQTKRKAKLVFFLLVLLCFFLFNFFPRERIHQSVRRGIWEWFFFFRGLLRHFHLTGRLLLIRHVCLLRIARLGDVSASRWGKSWSMGGGWVRMETMQSSLLSCDSPRAAGFILESGSGFRGGRVSSLSDLRCDSFAMCLSIHFRAFEISIHIRD